MPLFPAPRVVVHSEALSWLTVNPAAPGSSVITSLPDVSELAPFQLDAWRAWFITAARSVIRWVPEGGVAIFYQSDIRHQQVWIDKSYLIQRAVEDEQAALIWHKIVCRSRPGTITPGRPSYSHMLCVSKTLMATPTRPGPDVLGEAGYMPWSRAMGETACRVACRFLRDETTTKTVVDPFCGEGSVLAVANALGFAALGIDLSAKRCKAARQQTLEPSLRR
ncbi:MAG: SAM-dependent methyltransferase [Proteobacteria bacterium]|nr:SAM-dependent methyltransferase [Pseudomonadota bacterium]